MKGVEDEQGAPERTARLVPRLPRDAWVVLVGDALSAIGTGLTLPFLLVYYTQVRGIGLGIGGLAVSTVALAGFVGNPLGGWLSDRIGSRNALVGGLVVSAAGAAGIAFVTSTWEAFAASAVVGLGAAVVWPSQDALLALTVAAEQRPSAYSLRHATLNAGFGIGGLIAAVLVDVAAPSTFVTIYLIDALTFLAFIPLLLMLRVGARPPARDGAQMRRAAAGGYRLVLADRTFLRVWALTLLVVTISYGQYHATLPAFATGQGGVPPRALGLAYAANTFTIVAVQLFVLRALTGRARTTGIALACMVWAGTWVLAVVAADASAATMAAVLFTVTLVLFALGETLLSPTVTAIVNDLATDELRGRYNGLATLAWTTGFFLGPAVGGFVLDAGQGSTLFLALAGLCVAATLWSLSLARHLPPEANRIGDDEPVPAPAIVPAPTETAP